MVFSWLCFHVKFLMLTMHDVFVWCFIVIMQCMNEYLWIDVWIDTTLVKLMIWIWLMLWMIYGPLSHFLTYHSYLCQCSVWWISPSPLRKHGSYSSYRYTPSSLQVLSTRVKSYRDGILDLCWYGVVWTWVSLILCWHDVHQWLFFIVTLLKCCCIVGWCNVILPIYDMLVEIESSKKNMITKINITVTCTTFRKQCKMMKHRKLSHPSEYITFIYGKLL